jgi:hypothetical protein
MKLRYPVLIICFTVFSACAFSQSSDSDVVVAYASKNKGVDNKMNRMKVEPQLTQKLYNTGKGHDAYKLKDGMICLVPDSLVLQRMVIVKPKG